MGDWSIVHFLFDSWHLSFKSPRVMNFLQEAKNMYDKYDDRWLWHIVAIPIIKYDMISLVFFYRIVEWILLWTGVTRVFLYFDTRKLTYTRNNIVMQILSKRYIKKGTRMFLVLLIKSVTQFNWHNADNKNS